MFWAAGVQAERLNVTPALDTDRASRIKVNGDYSVPGHPHVFVVGWYTWTSSHANHFRNRLTVLFNWAWNYMFSRREARLIIDKEWKLRN